MVNVNDQDKYGECLLPREIVLSVQIKLFNLTSMALTLHSCVLNTI